MVTAFAQHVRREPLQSRSRLHNWLADLKLLGSVWLAHFIVWRVLRQERKEKAELKTFEGGLKCRI